MSHERVHAAVLAQEHLHVIGTSLKKVYRLEETRCFAELLEALDKADREHWREEDRKEALARLQQADEVSDGQLPSGRTRLFAWLTS